MTATQVGTDTVSWHEPDGVAPRGTVVVLPGRGEHPGVYERFGRRVAADGYRVHAVGDATVDEARVTATLRELVAADVPDAVAGAGPVPRIVVGSDTGALLAAGLAAGEPDGIDALVLAGFPVAGTRLTAVWETELAARTACPVHLQRLRDDPALRRGALAGPVPAAWLERADASRIAVPVLGLHGVDDPVAPLDAARGWYRGLARGELVSVAGGRHDVLNDRTHRSVAASVVLFLERWRLGGDVVVRREPLGASRA